MCEPNTTEMAMIIILTFVAWASGIAVGLASYPRHVTAARRIALVTLMAGLILTIVLNSLRP